MGGVLLYPCRLIKSIKGVFTRRVNPKKIDCVHLSTPSQSCKPAVSVSSPTLVTTPIAKSAKVNAPANNTSLIDLESLELNTGNNIPAIQRENIRPESLCLVHCDEFAPAGNRILSAREALTVDGIGASRNSVHFTLNHPVSSHRFGDWSNTEYVMLMPYNATKTANVPGKFTEGLANDLYTNGSVIIPKGSVIIKKNSNIPTGKIQVSNYPDIEGVKLIETSGSPHELSMPIMEKMGYSQASVSNGMGVFDIGIEKTSKEQYIDDIKKNFKYWSDFCAREGIKPMQHCGSPNGEAENMIECLNMLAADNLWISEFWGRSTNCKEAILENLKRINQNSQKYNYFLSFDTNKLAKIVEESATPRIALERVQQELNLRPVKILERNLKPEHRYNTSLDINLSCNDVKQRYIKFYNNEYKDQKTLDEFLENEALIFDLL